jgi:hypothetical protein
MSKMLVGLKIFDNIDLTPNNGYKEQIWTNERPLKSKPKKGKKGNKYNVCAKTTSDLTNFFYM